MRIAYLFGSLNRGGAETLLLDLFRNASKSTLDSIGIYRKTGVLEADFIQSGIPMYHVPFSRNIIGYLRRLRNLLLKNKVNIVHAQQPIDALYAWLACIGTDSKIALTLHGYDVDDTCFANRILRFIIKRTTVNIFVSNNQRQYYQVKYRLKQEKQQVVYNGISFDKLTSPLIPVSIREELKISSDSVLLGCVGNFVTVRDHYFVCRVLNLLKEHHVDFHFLFVGKRVESVGYLYDECVDFCRQKGLNDRVSFLGSRNDVPSILPQLDAFVYASDHDTFGIAVVEAMAAGVPVFVNDWEVMKEITEGGKYATLYKTKDEQDLFRHFMSFLQDRSSYQAKSLLAAEFVRKRYSIEQHTEFLKKVYQAIL